ncbi:MAG: glycosyltransferase family 39 protein [Clostridia bacterium]
MFNRTVVILGIVGFITALIFLSYVFKRFETFFEKKYKIILPVFMVLMLGVQIAMAFAMRFSPAFDLGAVYNGAVEWVNTGTFSSQYEYYYFFPNNLGAMTVYFGIFSIARAFGITDYFIVASVINAICSVLMMLFAALAVKKIFSTRLSMLMLVILSLSLPFYSIAPAFYTDALSMLFPVLVFYLFLRADDDALPVKKRVLYGLLMGLFAALGILIKFTVMIAPIAIFIYLLLKGRFKNLLIFSATSVSIILLTLFALNAIIYPAHLDKDVAHIKNTPLLHWTMMGLSEDGKYNPNDYVFTRSFENPNERDEAIKNEIKNRIEKMGFKGTAALFLNKASLCFGEATYASSDFLDDSPANNTDLHKFLLYNGENFHTYRDLCSISYFSCMILMIICGMRIALSFKKGVQPMLIPILCIFGIMLFLLFWETNGRYIVNFIPMMLIAAVGGVDTIDDRFFKNKEPLKMVKLKGKIDENNENI